MSEPRGIPTGCPLLWYQLIPDAPETGAAFKHTHTMSKTQNSKKPAKTATAKARTTKPDAKAHEEPDLFTDAQAKAIRAVVGQEINRMLEDGELVFDIDLAEDDLFIMLMERLEKAEATIKELQTKAAK